MRQQRTKEIQKENYKGLVEKELRSTRNSRFESANEGGLNETYYASVKMPCITQPDMSEQIKQQKTAIMKTNLDKHLAEKQKRMSVSDFLGMTDKELLLNKPILTKMGIL